MRACAYAGQKPSERKRLENICFHFDPIGTVLVNPELSFDVVENTLELAVVSRARRRRDLVRGTALDGGFGEEPEVVGVGNVFELRALPGPIAFGGLDALLVLGFCQASRFGCRAI